MPRLFVTVGDGATSAVPPLLGEVIRRDQALSSDQFLFQADGHERLSLKKRDSTQSIIALGNIAFL